MNTVFCRPIADLIEEQLIEEIKIFDRKPCLAVIQVGNNQASSVYVRNKIKACERIGIESITSKFEEDVTEEQLIKEIERMNNNPIINGILVQLPLPEHIDTSFVLEAINPIKDVDGFHCTNMGKLMAGVGKLLPCTPFGVIKILDYIGEPILGKHAVVVGTSNIVGKPMTQLLLEKGATVTMCNINTVDLAYHTKQADILVVAVGKEKLITADMVKDGVIVIDVGINRNSEGKLCGDIDFVNVKEKASYITPVPKGVGVMTVTMLMYNTVEAYKLQLLN